MVSGAFAWDTLGWYNVRSLGHSALEAASIGPDTITLAGADEWADLQKGDRVDGYAGDNTESMTSYYVTDKTEDAVALQDAEKSFGYVRSKDDVLFVEDR